MATDGSRKRPRGPGVVYSVTACVAVLALGAVALTANQAPPPTVAEFAPAALDQIDEAPDRQGTDVGEGEDGGTGGSASPSPSAAPSPTTSPPPVIDVPRVRKCVGNPPRQIEDPQSPPCVPYFDGDNGGATTFGVTRDEIRVAVPYGTFLTGDPTPLYEAMANFFNSRFEFYGRKIRLLKYAARGDNFAQPNPPDMIADATRVASEFKAFASTGYLDRKGAEHTYYNELARRGIIAMIGRDTALGTEAFLQKRDPYLWSRGTATDTMFRNIGQFTCAQLAGRPPSYGGPYRFVPPPEVRKFGIIVVRANDGTIPDVTPLRTALGACGVRPVIVEGPEAEDARGGLNPILRMNDEQVTSIICLCNAGTLRGGYMQAASGQGYQPEWILSSYINNDLDNSFVSAPPEQTTHVIGISFNNKSQRKQDAPWYWAFREGNPSMPPPGDAAGYYMGSTYEQLLLLASGIQMAGPNLTPETFAAALHRTQFPNPGAGAAPYYQARVGFPGTTHSMKLDAAMYWHDPSGQGTVDPASTGVVCYVARGARWGIDTWPRQEMPFRQGPCR